MVRYGVIVDGLFNFGASTSTAAARCKTAASGPSCSTWADSGSQKELNIRAAATISDDGMLQDTGAIS